MILWHATDLACGDCISEIVILDGASHLGRPVAVMGHSGSCPTLRAVQRAEVPPLWRKAGR